MEYEEFQSFVRMFGRWPLGHFLRSGPLDVPQRASALLSKRRSWLGAELAALKDWQLRAVHAALSAGGARPYNREICLIGLGIPESAAMTLEALASIRRCRVLFVNDPEHDFWRGLGPKTLPIGRVETEDSGRQGEAFAHRALATLRGGGPVGVAIYGHPLLYEPITQKLLELCRGAGVKVTVISGVSTIDAALSALRLGLTQGRGLQVGDAKFFVEHGFRPAALALAYKAFQNEATYRGLVARATRDLPSGTRAARVVCRNWPSIPDDVEWRPLPSAGRLFRRPELFATLLLAPPEAKRRTR